ncbi:Hypothetical protein, putative [Bodo saltans]|uniref:Uncharacterized protein n=1 Tax=Bodo saltans TaxID=75058 RepID=A0A0S4IV05_BODSA|nr:Hypothetical protein, putative [Bodo saltans]|eukprot:CUG14689.1 Hypothetical protein, putative [Bodo saltans]
MTRRVAVPAPPSVVSSLTASNVTTPVVALAAGAQGTAAVSHVSSSRSSSVAKQQQAREALVDRLSHLEAEIAKERLAHEETQRSFQRTAKEVELLREIVAARFENSGNSSNHEQQANHTVPTSPRKQVRVVAPAAKRSEEGDVASVATSSTIMSTSTLYGRR